MERLGAGSAIAMVVGRGLRDGHASVRRLGAYARARRSSVCFSCAGMASCGGGISHQIKLRRCGPPCSVGDGHHGTITDKEALI